MGDSIDGCEPWRKAFPNCKPFGLDGVNDGERFYKEFPEGMNAVDADKDWTVGDVLEGSHKGGRAPGAPTTASAAEATL